MTAEIQHGEFDHFMPKIGITILVSSSLIACTSQEVSSSLTGIAFGLGIAATGIIIIKADRKAHEEHVHQNNQIYKRGQELLDSNNKSFRARLARHDAKVIAKQNPDLDPDQITFYVGKHG